MTPRQLRILVAGGAAAGLASVFNAPLGGAVFALEVLVGTLALEAAGPVVVAAVAGTTLGRGFLGNLAAVETPAYHLQHPSELLAYFWLGLGCGALAAVFGRGLSSTVKAADALPLPSWLKPALGGLVVGLLGLITPRVFGNGYETVNALVHGRLVETALLLLLGVKLLATWTSLGSGAPGGLFGPSLYLGAVAGGFVGAATGQVLTTAPTGAYAVVGMAAMVAGTTHAPVAMVLMMFEMTGDYEIVLPLLLATTVSSVVSRRLHGPSADQVIDAVRGRSTGLAEGLSVPVEEAMRIAPESVVQLDAPLSQIAERFLRARSDVLSVVNKQGVYAGAILLEDVQLILQQMGTAGHLVVADDLRREDLPVLGPDDPLALAVDALSAAPCGTLPVVDPGTHAPVGLLEGKQVLSAWRGEQLRAEVQALVRGEERPTRLDLAPGAGMVRVVAPPWLVNRTLAEEDLRRRTGLSVVAIRGPGDGDRMRLPDPREPIAIGAVLLVTGPSKALHSFGQGEVPAEPPPRT